MSAQEGHDPAAPGTTGTANAAWSEELVLELRLGGMSGPAIGAALAEVESVLSEGGAQAQAQAQTQAQEELGPARAYAAALLAGSSGLAPGLDGRFLGSLLAQLLGLLAVLNALPALASGEPFPIPLGSAVSAGLALLVVGLLWRWPARWIRAASRASWVGTAAAAFAVFALTGLPALLLHGITLATVWPAWPVGIGVLLLLGGTLGLWPRAGDRDGGEDPVLSPFAGEEERRIAAERRTLPLTALILPVMTAIAGMGIVLLGR